ncbi:N6-L-threonylcarbamoyladenine synthase [Peptostreptococcaceae bacterium pGA-8]|nr:N6-L-threonylcarbamoyladenine synthase [Peptostreptococcaceae bacterium pGA-8]
MKNIYIGIDTSNYKTSVAAVDEQGTIIANFSKLLPVPMGARGLRQSDALYHHIDTLPKALESVFDELKNCDDEYDIKAVSVSTRPRDMEGSYMPVFKGGYLAAKSISESLRVPLFEFSHQDGHIMAGRFLTSLKAKNRFIGFHFSGGTTEALLIENDKIQLIGGTKDISFGQLIDRLGVKQGLGFPAGAEMDIIALNNDNVRSSPLPQIKVNGLSFNISGIETSVLNNKNNYPKEDIIKWTFIEIAHAICNLIENAGKLYDEKDILLVGGVSSSLFIRSIIEEKLSKKYNLYFPEPMLCSDNAIGIAMLGKERYGKTSCNCNGTK